MAFCTTCGSQVSDTARFCTNCGKAMGTVAAAPPPPPPNYSPVPSAQPLSMHDDALDYTIQGDNLQIIRIKLKPGQELSDAECREDGSTSNRKSCGKRA